MSAVSSPCVKICIVDPRSGICTGCGRTLAEIGNWLRFSESERLKVAAQLADRLLGLQKRESA